MRTEFRWRAEKIADIVRGQLVFKKMADMKNVLDIIVKSNELIIGRCKNRFAETTPGGWADCSLNITMSKDQNEHRCELQLVHFKLMSIREDICHAHDEYEKFRSAQEVLVLLGADKSKISPAPGNSGASEI